MIDWLTKIKYFLYHKNIKFDLRYKKTVQYYYTCRIIRAAGCLFFSLMAKPMAYGSSWARAWIQAAAVIHAPGVATPDPLTNYVELGIEPAPPQWPEPLQLDS